MNPSRAHQAISPELFRRLMSRFASGVTVVTAVDGANRAHGMTVSAFSSVSLDPPLVLVCVDHTASMLSVLNAADFFAVNILASDQVSISRRFSVEEMELRFDGIGYSLGASGSPMLHGALAVMECRRVACHTAGDHLIVIGEVVTGDVTAGAQPLVYYAGAYGRVEP